MKNKYGKREREREREKKIHGKKHENHVQNVKFMEI
jgi:hypothetical protein